LAPGYLDVDDSGLDWAVVDVITRHQVPGQRPKLGHVEQRLGGESPDLRGKIRGKADGVARLSSANSRARSPGLDLLCPLLPGGSYWWNCSGISSGQAQGKLELQVSDCSLLLSPASPRRYGPV